MTKRKGPNNDLKTIDELQYRFVVVYLMSITKYFMYIQDDELLKNPVKIYKYQDRRGRDRMVVGFMILARCTGYNIM